MTLNKKIDSRFSISVKYILPKSFLPQTARQILGNASILQSQTGWLHSTLSGVNRYPRQAAPARGGAARGDAASPEAARGGAARGGAARGGAARGGAARGAVRREGRCAGAAAAKFKTSQPRTCLPPTACYHKMSDTSESAACQHEIKSARILLYTEETAAVARVLPEKNLSRPRKDGKGMTKGQPEKCWDLPGGKLKDGESPADAVARELLEETGLKLGEIGATRCGVEEFKYEEECKMAVYVFTIPTELPVQAGDGIAEVQWTPLEQAREKGSFPLKRAFQIADFPLPPAASPAAVASAEEPVEEEYTVTVTKIAKYRTPATVKATSPEEAMEKTKSDYDQMPPPDSDGYGDVFYGVEPEVTIEYAAEKSSKRAKHA
eukprot:COSAG01_NODE_3737_length_5747_cov_40.714058_8_plen_379_part_00